MQRRDFLKYSAVTTSTMMFPSLATSKELDKMIKMAWYCSKLNPIRFVAGLIFDLIAEVFVKPLVKQAFLKFMNGHSISKNSLAYYDSSSVLEANKAYEPYKASTVVYGVADYEKYKEGRREKLRLLLTGDNDTKRFNDITQYYKDEKVKLKLYDSKKLFVVGDYLEPTDLFDVDYVVYKDGSKEEDHSKNLLEITKNSAFKKIIV